MKKRILLCANCDEKAIIPVLPSPSGVLCHKCGHANSRIDNKIGYFLHLRRTLVLSTPFVAIGLNYLLHHHMLSQSISDDSLSASAMIRSLFIIFVACVYILMFSLRFFFPAYENESFERSFFDEGKKSSKSRRKAVLSTVFTLAIVLAFALYYSSSRMTYTNATYFIIISVMSHLFNSLVAASRTNKSAKASAKDEQL